MLEFTEYAVHMEGVRNGYKIFVCEIIGGIGKMDLRKNRFKMKFSGCCYERADDVSG
jgi:hypothetical protein